MLSCRELVDHLDEYLDGDAAEALRRSLEHHLAHCRTCRVIVDTTRKTVRIVTESGEHDLAERLPDADVFRIMDRIRQAREDEGGG